MGTSGSEPPFKVTPAVFHVLLSLAQGEAHGYAIMSDVDERTRGRVKIGPGSLYFTLDRLSEADLIEGTDGPADADDERRRYYRLTPYGRSVLVSELELMSEIVESARVKRLLADASAA